MYTLLIFLFYFSPLADRPGIRTRFWTVGDANRVLSLSTPEFLSLDGNGGTFARNHHFGHLPEVVEAEWGS